MTPSQDRPDPPPFPPLSESSGLCGGPGQISCSEANEMLQLYVDRYTDAESGIRMAEHLGACPPCESEVVVYQRIIAALQRCRPDLPADTAERLHRFCADLHEMGPGAADDTTTPA